jgi:NAD(P)-dependent dehydrogenase (short-subunit alcohol dehydrogenase family)
MSLYYLIPAGCVVGVYLIRKLREYQWGWVRNNASLKGKIFIITGANTGLGYETALALTKRQATVIMACRSLDRANEAKDKIRRETNEGTVIVLRLDLASFESIRAFVTKIKTDYPKFDCLINNAGLAVTSNQKTQENFELTFGTNHLGHFLLTELLKENIKANNSRIVVVSSTLHQRGNIDFPNLGKFYPQPPSRRNNQYYNDSKLMNFYFSRELYKMGYDVHVLCPGLCFTDFFRDYNRKWYHWIMFAPIVWLMLRSAKQGAQNIIYCATDSSNTPEKNPATGYFIRSLKQDKSKLNFDDTVSRRLWEHSLKLCGLEV